jgi:tetraacyldisaccharide-1-P 4'-kinase
VLAGGRELRRLTAHARAAGVEALVTTEKDVMNLPADCAKWIAPLRLLFLRIGVEPEDPERLLRLVEDRIAEARGREP